MAKLAQIGVKLCEFWNFASNKCAVFCCLEKLSQDIIDKRIALEAVKRGKVMNQDSRVTWLKVVEKIGSIEKLSDSKDVLEELLKDFETLKQSCGSDNEILNFHTMI